MDMLDIIILLLFICIVPIFLSFFDDVVVDLFDFAGESLQRAFKHLRSRCSRKTAKKNSKPRSNPELDSQLSNLRHQKTLLRLDLCALEAEEQILRVLSKTRR